MTMKDALDTATNYYGKLDAGQRQAIMTFMTAPSEATWDAIASVVINAKSLRRATIWQAVTAIDSGFPRTKSKSWERIPTVFTVARAIREAV